MAYERLEEAPFKEIIVTDTIPLQKELKKAKVLSTAKLFAEVINRVENKKSISSLFQFSTK